MILDGHVHIRQGDVDRAKFREQIRQAGVDGAVVLSPPPTSFRSGDAADDAERRLDCLLSWAEGEQDLYPFYWIDPVEDDAIDQVGRAVERGVKGFKVICGRHYPGDERAMPVYREIAKAGKPILFHSGILWDGRPSGQYSRPVGFEALLGVDGLKFCLAHISWPWYDECIAVYGKFLNAHSRRPGLAEMFIDVTPGTPPIYRRDALTKLFTVGYDVEHNVIFGTDCCANDYNHRWAREWIERDRAIYAELGLSQETIDAVFGENLRRFVGKSSAEIEHRALRPGES